MQPTNYPGVNHALRELLSRIQYILGSKLVGLYLEGSLVIGDFDPKISDIDLLAALTYEIDEEEFDLLEKMHNSFVKEYPEWHDRIEVCYITLDALKTFRTKNSTIVNISPGEPFHRMESSKEWLMNWYLTRENSLALFGPSPKTIIDSISKEEFIQCVKDHSRSWNIWVQNMRNPYAQSYAILSMCRAFYSYKSGDQVSKIQAARWAQKELPMWSELIQKALVWRKGGKYLEADELTHPHTVKFVNFVRDLILGE